MAQKKITDLTLRSDFDATCNVPVDDTSQTWRATGQQILDFIKAQYPQKVQQSDISNLAIATSVAANALTVAIKTKAGTDPSSTDKIEVGMRSSSLTSGTFNIRSLTSALSMVLSSGSTLGQTDNEPSLIYVYLIDNGGTLELAVSHSFYPEDALVTTTAEGGGGAADSPTAIYSTAARSSVPLRFIGAILNTQTTAGTWASAGSQIQLQSAVGRKVPTIQKFTSGSDTYYTPAGVKWLRVRGCGGGGGGAAGVTTSTALGGDSGNDTTFGTSLLTGSGGDGGGSGGNPTANGGAATVASSATVLELAALAGADGAGGSYNNNSSDYATGGIGGTNAFGGAGAGGILGANGQAAKANTGAGGGGAGSGVGSAYYAGQGGGAGGYFEAIILNPDSSYDYAVGSGGAGYTGTNIGGSGASGIIIVEEHY